MSGRSARPSTRFGPTARPSPALAVVDWTRHFRRVCLDPVQGLITLMAPSFLHDDVAVVLGDLVDAAASAFDGASRGLRHTRLRGPDDPPGTGMEPDCAFYVGDRARAFREALRDGEEAAESCIVRTAPDLVVEVEITNVDEGKIARYADLGVRELWRLRGDRKSAVLGVDFLALGKGAVPRKPRRLGGAPRAHRRRCARRGALLPPQHDARRAGGGGRPCRAPPQAPEHPGA